MSTGSLLSDALRAAFGTPGCTAALAAMGIAGQARRTRMLGLGQAAFVASGALGLAMTSALVDVPLWCGLVVAAGFASGVGLLQALPIVRDASSEVVGVVALATAETARRILAATRPDWFGGADGLFVPAGQGGIPSGSGPFGMSARGWWAGIVGWAVVAAVVAFGAICARSSRARARASLGEDPLLAASVGVDVRAVRIESLAAAATLGVLGGLLLAAGGETVRASSFSIDLLAVMLVGVALTGWTRRLPAAVAASVAVGGLTAGRSWLESWLERHGSVRLGTVSIITDASRIESLQFLVMGVVLLAVVVARARWSPDTTRPNEVGDGY